MHTNVREKKKNGIEKQKKKRNERKNVHNFTQCTYVVDEQLSFIAHTHTHKYIQNTRARTHLHTCTLTRKQTHKLDMNSPS